MIFNDEVCFIHTPKTAGMSVSMTLLRLLRKPVCYLVPDNHAQEQELAIPGVKVHQGLRHEDLAQARSALQRFDRKLADFDVVFTFIRNPYDLDVSLYHYLRLGHPWDKGEAQRIALEGDYAAFAREAPFLGHRPSRIERFYTLDGELLPNMKILRFENLDQQIKLHLGEYLPGFEAAPALNATRHKDYSSYLTRETEAAVYEKYRWIFDKGFYPRVFVADDAD